MGCGGFTCSKNALAALNVLYILVALILIITAAYGKAQAIITSISIMSGIIACGVFLLLIAFVGLIGAIKHHQVLLFFYMIILFLIFLVQFSVACACLAVNTEQQKRIVKKGWIKSDASIKSQVQTMNWGDSECCGFDNDSQDNIGAGLGHPLCGPDGDDLSGCRNSNAVCCVGKPDNTTLTTTLTGSDAANGTIEKCPMTPCWLRLQDSVDSALKISGGIGLFFSFTEIIGVVLALRYRNQKDPRANPSAFL